jgi:hypothetical protein
MEASVAWAMAVAGAASPGWAMAVAMEAVDMDLATSTLPALGDIDSLDSTELLSRFNI